MQPIRAGVVLYLTGRNLSLRFTVGSALPAQLVATAVTLALLPVARNLPGPAGLGRLPSSSQWSLLVVPLDPSFGIDRAGHRPKSARAIPTARISDHVTRHQVRWAKPSSVMTSFTRRQRRDDRRGRTSQGARANQGFRPHDEQRRNRPRHARRALGAQGAQPGLQRVQQLAESGGRAASAGGHHYPCPAVALG